MPKGPEITAASNAPTAGPYLGWRLGLLLFLQYAPFGAVLPLLSLRLEELGFTPGEMGWTFATQSLAALAAPLAAGQVADRWWPADRCLVICGFAGAGLFWLMAGLTDFPTLLPVSLAVWLVMTPSLTLGTSLCFAHLRSPESEFGKVRLWGTLGWVAAVWLMSFWFDNPPALVELVGRIFPGHSESSRADIFRLAALLSLLLGIYALTLPHTPPRRTGHWLAPLAALQLLRGRAFAVYTAVVLGLCVTLPFSGQLTPLLLEQQGLELPWIGRALTIAQSMEVVALGLLPLLLYRLGTRGTMRLGLAAWALALALLAIGRPVELVLGSLTLNGLCISFYIVAGQVFINRQAHGEIRASAQALLAFTGGLGNTVGHVLVGDVRYWTGEGFSATLTVAAMLAALLLAAFCAGFPADAE